MNEETKWPTFYMPVAGMNASGDDHSVVHNAHKHQNVSVKIRLISVDFITGENVVTEVEATWATMKAARNRTLYTKVPHNEFVFAVAGELPSLPDRPTDIEWLHLGQWRPVYDSRSRRELVLEDITEVETLDPAIGVYYEKQVRYRSAQ